MLQCTICGITIESIFEAMSRDWIPYFYQGDTEHGPVCETCSETFIRMGDDGHFEMRREFEGKIVYKDDSSFPLDETEDPLQDLALDYILN